MFVRDFLKLLLVINPPFRLVRGSIVFLFLRFFTVLTYRVLFKFVISSTLGIATVSSILNTQKYTWDSMLRLFSLYYGFYVLYYQLIQNIHLNEIFCAVKFMKALHMAKLIELSSMILFISYDKFLRMLIYVSYLCLLGCITHNATHFLFSG